MPNKSRGGKRAHACPLLVRRFLTSEVAGLLPPLRLPCSLRRPLLVQRDHVHAGALVEVCFDGLEGVIGIKVSDKTGQGIAVKGNIEDDEGKIVAFFESHEFGLGAVKFKPKNSLNNLMIL